MQNTGSLHRSILLVVAGLCLTGTACAGTVDPNSADAPAPTISSNTTRIVLRAWEATRVGLPPLAITRADSVATVVAFVNARTDNWRRVDSLPSNPLPAEFYEGDRVAQRFGVVDIPGETGFFVAWRGSEIFLRPVPDAEWGQFLAFFGIGIITVE